MVRVDRLVRTGAKRLGLIQTTGLIWAVGLKWTAEIDPLDRTEAT